MNFRKFQTKLPSDFDNQKPSNEQQQNVQNERKIVNIHDSIVHINDHTHPPNRLKRDADNLFKDNDVFVNYDDNQNDGKC